MPVIVNKGSTTKADIERINRYFYQACQLFKDDQDVLDDLEDLKNCGLKMVEWLHEYDVVQGVPENGFRTIFWMSLRLVRNAIINFSQIDKIDFKGVLHNYKNGIKYVNRLREESKESKSLELSDETWADLTIDFFNAPDSVRHFYTRVNQNDIGWLGKITYSVVFGSKARRVSPSLLTYLRTFIDKEHRKTLVSMTAEDLQPLSQRDAENIGLPIALMFNSFMVVGYGRPGIVTDIDIPRQTKFKIKIAEDGLSSFVEDTTTSGFDTQKVKCRFIKKTSEEPEVLMINMHGGGFVFGDRTINDPFLRRWVDQIPNLAAISVEYSLSPMVMFPVALQECLDVYLFFADPTNSDAIRSLVGFVPKKIIISGDSAGGHLAFAMTVALKMVEATLPTGIFVFYPVTTLYPGMKPSFLAGAPNGLLFIPFYTYLIESYVPENYPKAEYNDDIQHEGDHPQESFFQSGLKWLFSTKMLPDPKPIDEDRYRKLAARRPLVKDPLVSPLYADLTGLSSVPLFSYPSRSDAFLDEGLMMAAKWPGPTVVKVVDNLMHGYLSYGGAINDSVDAIDMIGKDIDKFINGGGSLGQPECRDYNQNEAN